MKILAISGSPRKDGNTVTLLNEYWQERNRMELMSNSSVSGENIQPCIAVTASETGKCHIRMICNSLRQDNRGQWHYLRHTDIFL